MTTNLAASSFAQMRFIQETAWGTTPTTGNGVELRMTGESLNYTRTKTNSNEINKARQIRGLAVTDVNAAGGINFEFSYQEYDPFIAALLMGSWVFYGTAGTSAEIVGDFDTTDPTYDTLTFAIAPTGADALTQLKASYYVKIKGSGVDLGLLGQNEGIFQVQVDGTTTVLKFPKNSFTNATGKHLTITSAWVKIGNTKQSFTLEKEFTDVSQFFSYTGMMVSKGSWNFATGSLMTGTFDFMGSKGQRTDATVLPGSPVASQSYPLMSSVTGIADIRVGGVPIKTKYNSFAKTLTLDFDNQLEGLQAIGNLGAVDVMPKEIKLGGSLDIYLSDGSLYNDFVNDVEQSLSWVTHDPSGNGYAFVLDRINLNEAPTQAGGNGQAVMLSAKWTGLQGAASQNSLTIFRL